MTRTILTALLLFLMVASVQAATVNLAWDASTSSGIVSYNVYRSTTSGSGYVKIGSSTTLSYSDATVPNTGQRFYYVVTALNVGGAESGYSNEVFFVEVPGSPTNLRRIP